MITVSLPHNAVAGRLCQHDGVEVDIEALRQRALAWLDDDPDPATRAELRAVLDGLPGTASELADRFAGPLTFGTAGLRGPVRAGPNGMNLAVVHGATAGLVAWLADQGADGPVVIGYDARHGSAAFAAEAARVVTGAGRRALLLPRPLPTPVLAYAVRALEAVAGVMVTASHNPPADNGYKMYLGARLGGDTGAGAQIVPPADRQIEAAIRAVGALRTVPLGPPPEVVDESIVESYLDGAVAVVDPDGPRDIRLAYTPLHGVGAATALAAFERAGFGMPVTVASQLEPDPDFPTVAFPNPEEPGAMDAVIAAAAESGADLAIANDPDADRCAVAVPDPRRGDPATPTGWRLLRGDEVGVLLADHLMRRGRTGRYTTTIVSSSLLRAMCADRGLPYGETLTGFKWIVRAGDDLTFGYEEALGYCVAPWHVRDKDGITAALTVAELAAELARDGQTLLDRLAELATRYGLYATDQASVRVADLSVISQAMARLRATSVSTLGGHPVTETRDLLPEADVVILRTEHSRVVVRPSGTEPKLKVYLEVVEPVTDSLPAAETAARAGLEALRADISTILGV